MKNPDLLSVFFLRLEVELALLKVTGFTQIGPLLGEFVQKGDAKIS